MHDPRGGRSFTLAVTDGHAWRFYLATRHCVQSMEEETDKIRIEQTENLLYQEEDRWRIIEILADMVSSFLQVPVSIIRLGALSLVTILDAVREIAIF